MDPPYKKSVSVEAKLMNSGSNSILDDFLCGLCHRQQDDPRVLPCFHSFCLACLQQHQQNGLSDAFTRSDSRGNISNGSNSSTGYESDAVESNWIRCPNCEYLGRLPLGGGVKALPPNYVLQHKILLAGLNHSAVAFFCDVCSTDIPALARCSDCLVNVCSNCLDIHSKQPLSSTHLITALQTSPGASSNNAITAVKRQLMCCSHPDRELTLFCSDCQKIVCKSCCTLVHRGHSCDAVDRAARHYTLRLRKHLDKAKSVQKESRQTLENLKAMAQRIEGRCSQVESEIDNFIDGYILALQEHRKLLRAAVAESRATKLRVVDHHHNLTTKSVNRANQALVFAGDLLSEGAPAELLVFAGSLLSHFDSTAAASSSTGTLPDVKTLETINLLTEEKAPAPVLNKQVYGVVTTQRVSPQQSTINANGLLALNNARQQQMCDVTLVSRDSDGQPMCHGGEQVMAHLNYRDIARRCIPVQVHDNQDGTYAVSFTPDSAGNMALSVTIRGTPTQGSPYPVCVRTLRPHHGTFHCCSFCSSSGKKYITCGCGGTMPGGYKGCGHGHVGHPGRRHWSCCGNTLHNSECGKPPPTFYHLTL